MPQNHRKACNVVCVWGRDEWGEGREEGEVEGVGGNMVIGDTSIIVNKELKSKDAKLSGTYSAFC